MWLRCGQLTFIFLCLIFLQQKGLEGFAAWVKAQSREENDQPICWLSTSLNVVVWQKWDAIDTVPQEWESPLAVFEHVYKHECHVSELIDKLVDVAADEKDKASQDFLWGFVREQVEEEATVQGIVDKIKLGGEAGLFYLDAQLGARK